MGGSGLPFGDQPGLDGKYMIFARVAEGILVAQKISETAVDEKGLAVDRVVVNKVTIRDRPADVPEPFSTEPIEELARYRAVLDTSMGEITLSFTPEKAPNRLPMSSALPVGDTGTRPIRRR